MTDSRSRVRKVRPVRGLKYFGRDLKEVFTTFDDEQWQFVRIQNEDYPRKCVTIEGNEILVSVACLEAEGTDKPAEVGVEFVDAKVDECQFLYIVDADGEPIEWKIKK